MRSNRSKPGLRRIRWIPWKKSRRSVDQELQKKNVSAFCFGLCCFCFHDVYVEVVPTLNSLGNSQNVFRLVGTLSGVYILICVFFLCQHAALIGWLPNLLKYSFWKHFGLVFHQVFQTWQYDADASLSADKVPVSLMQENQEMSSVSLCEVAK